MTGSLEGWLLLVMNGLVSGSLYALVAMGFVLVYKTSGVINFAQGELVLAGGMTAAFLTHTWQVPYALAIVGALVVAIGWGVVIDRGVVGPLAGREPIAVMMATIAIGVIVRNVTLLIAGADTKALPQALPGTPVVILGFPVAPLQLTMAGLAVTLALGLTALLQFTRLGLAMRAMASDPQAASGMGIPVQRMYGWSWILSAVVAALGGIALGNLIGVDASLSFVGLRVFPAVILGGLDSLKGAIVGGLAVGLIENLAGAFVNPFVILLLILMIRPTGLFGSPQVRRV